MCCVSTLTSRRCVTQKAGNGAGNGATLVHSTESTFTCILLTCVIKQQNWNPSYQGNVLDPTILQAYGPSLNTINRQAYYSA